MSRMEFLKLKSSDGEVPVLRFSSGSLVRDWQLPSFPLSGGYTVINDLEGVRQEEDGSETWTFSLQNSPAELLVQVRHVEGSEFTRIRYSLRGEDRFRGHDGKDPVRYGCISGTSVRMKEIQLSQFDRILHSFVPSEYNDTYDAWQGREVIGPVILAENTDGAVLGAYEHGAEAPDHFLAWYPEKDRISLRSVKGNYYDGQAVEEYAAPWIEIGLYDAAGETNRKSAGEMADETDKEMAGEMSGKAEGKSAGETLLRAWRRFLLEEMAPYGDSRKPLVFYNSWHVQEGKKYFCGDSYLKYLNDDFILRDIDIAHRMGVEVYVIDTGWFQKTGDWEVNGQFFPDRLKAVRERLNQYGMRLGLWFNPIAAARSSKMYRTHPEYVMSWQGEETYWGKIWETEESYGMCLASGYSDMFIETLVRLNRELGVSYFKWDAVGQYGCDCPDHMHGSMNNDPSERADAYAYRMGLEMIRIASEVSRQCPGAIVDFDVTEGQRCMGLGFLSAGKYFLINNGPYFRNFDIPASVRMEPDTINVFFYPGAARPQICRQAARFDPYVPSVLFLTHFFPHGPKLSRQNSMAAFALGGNGIWGFLQEMDEEGIQDWAEFIENYKKVREDVTAAYPVRSGNQGSSPEIYEKRSMENGRGIVVFFTHGAGSFTYVTQPVRTKPSQICGADEVTYLDNDRIRLEVKLEEDEARVVFFF